MWLRIIWFFWARRQQKDFWSFCNEIVSATHRDGWLWNSIWWASMLGGVIIIPLIMTAVTLGTPVAVVPHIMVEKLHNTQGWIPVVGSFILGFAITIGFLEISVTLHFSEGRWKRFQDKIMEVFDE